MHRVSDNLQHRHPYNDPSFRESTDPKEVARAFGSQAIPKYHRLLEMDDLPDEDRCRALQEFRELLSNQETKYSAVGKELVLTCANLTEVPSAAVRSEAALTIAALVLCEPDKDDELGNEVLLTSAAKILRDEVEDVVVSGCTIFRNLVVTLEGAALVAGREEIVHGLTAMITEPPLKLVPLPVLELVIEILGCLTRVYEGARCVAHYPIFTPLLTVLKKPRLYRIETILHSAQVISNAAMHNQGKLDAIREGAVEICLRVLTKNLNGALPSGDGQLTIELTRSIVGAVMGLSTVEEAKPQVIEFGVDPLARCLMQHNIAIKRNAAIAINSACESPGGTFHFTQRLLCETSLVVEVLGVKAISSLVKNVNGEDDDDKLASLKVIHALVTEYSDGSAAEQVIQTLGLLNSLVDITLLTAGAERNNLEIQQLASKILQKMCGTSDNHCRRIGKLIRKHGADEQNFSTVTGFGAVEFEQRFA